jgi:hypothetical protein
MVEREQVEEIKRHFGIVAAALRSDLRQVAEGHSVIRHELQEFRSEVWDEFQEMRAPKLLAPPNLQRDAY